MAAGGTIMDANSQQQPGTIADQKVAPAYPPTCFFFQEASWPVVIVHSMNSLLGFYLTRTPPGLYQHACRGPFARFHPGEIEGQLFFCLGTSKASIQHVTCGFVLKRHEWNPISLCFSGLLGFSLTPRNKGKG